MDILDNFSSGRDQSLTYHCIKEGCNNFHVSAIGGGSLYMICKRHGEERPLMRYDGKKERDLKEEPDVKDALPQEQANEILSLIKQCLAKRLTGDKYFQKLAEFWNKNGFPEYAEETLLYVTD